MKRLIAIILCALIALCPLTSYAINIEEPCGLTEEELASRLKTLAPYAKNFLWAEEDYGINACFLAAIAAGESGWGQHRFRPNNIFGFGKKPFKSVEHSIDYVAWYLRKNYLNEDGRYYHGATIEGVSICYCAGEQSWINLISGIANQLSKED